MGEHVDVERGPPADLPIEVKSGEARARIVPGVLRLVGYVVEAGEAVPEGAESEWHVVLTGKDGSAGETHLSVLE